MNYLVNADEPEDRYNDDSLQIPFLKRQMNPQTMRDEFRRIARGLRGEF